MSTKLYIKYMVSLRCKLMVKEELKKLGLEYVVVDLGTVEMHYSSVAHLSNQFKKLTGLTPTFYKQLKEKRKGNLEDF